MIEQSVIGTRGEGPAPATYSRITRKREINASIDHTLYVSAGYYDGIEEGPYRHLEGNRECAHSRKDFIIAQL